MNNPYLQLRCQRCQVYFNPNHEYKTPKEMSFKYCWECKQYLKYRRFEAIVITIVFLLFIIYVYYTLVFIPAGGGL